MASELIQVRDHLLDILSAAQTKFRKKYPDTADWIAKEHEVMLNEVNRMLADRGRSTITLTDLRAAEQLAVGHTDYSSKFSLYCAEIVLGCYKGIP